MSFMVGVVLVGVSMVVVSFIGFFCRCLSLEIVVVGVVVVRK